MTYLGSRSSQNLTEYREKEERRRQGDEKVVNAIRKSLRKDSDFHFGYAEFEML